MQEVFNKFIILQEDGSKNFEMKGETKFWLRIISLNLSKGVIHILIDKLHIEVT